MTTASMVRCSYCHTAVPAAETFTPIPNGVYVRCRDTKGCERRQAGAYDPTIPRDEDRPVPPPVGAPPGTVCAYCGTAATEGLYANGVAWLCRDRAGCAQRSVAFQYLRSWTDESPDRLIAESGGHLRLPAAQPVEVPARQVELTPAEREGLAASEALGRKRPGR